VIVSRSRQWGSMLERYVDAEICDDSPDYKSGASGMTLPCRPMATVRFMRRSEHSSKQLLYGMAHKRWYVRAFTKLRTMYRGTPKHYSVISVQENYRPILCLRLPGIHAQGFLLSFQLFTLVRKGTSLETNKTFKPTNSDAQDVDGSRANCSSFVR
jgi:hypothetical protein